MKKTLYFVHISLIFTGIFLSFSINAAMYKWVDEDGNTHYSQSAPVDNTDVEEIEPPSKVDTESAANKVKNENETADKLRDDRITKKEEKLKAEEDAIAEKQKCEQARKRLASYQRNRVNLKNSDGSNRVISEEERQSEIAKSKENIKTFCK